VTGVRAAANAALATADPTAKTASASALADAWEKGDLVIEETAPPPPDRPARPPRPLLAPPSAMPRRRLGGEAGRAALLHAVAHIEFNAVDLALDLVARFAHRLPAELDRGAFVSDWLAVARDEARHFGWWPPACANLTSDTATFAPTAPCGTRPSLRDATSPLGSPSRRWRSRRAAST